MNERQFELQKEMMWEMVLMIVDKLEEIRCCIINVEEETKKIHLTSRRSRAAEACVHWKSCCHARPECPNLYSCYKPPPA